MSRRSRTPSPGVSLFPFLAVLVCTMGALIVLLVLVVQQAQAGLASAEEDAAAAAARQAELAKRAEIKRRELVERREGLIWKAKVLHEARDEKLDQIEQQRSRLTHLETHIRELQQQWKQLQDRANAVRATRDGAGPETGGNDAKLKAIQAALALAKQELEAAQARAAEPPSFAVIPYHGANATKRRPIYLECRKDGIMIQPEGVLLGASDFAGLAGPGNPLDAALRAIRQYWLQHGLIQSAREPYPLLIVRPSGILAYGLGRAGLEHWDDSFGYELVSESLPLAYPKPDPALAESIRQAIQEARSRQAALARAMPRAFSDAARKLMEAASRHGDSLEAVPGQFGMGTSNRDGEQNDASRSRPNAPNAGPDAGGRAGSIGGRGLSAPLADSRGSDWALPSDRKGTSWSRPITIDLRSDALLLPPETAGQPGVSIRFDQGELAVADALANHLKRRLESWGIPPAGGYWRPVLKVRVGPGAELRFRSLELLLRRSGLKWERK